MILQHDRFNRTALNTVVVVMLTSQLRYEALPGNVRLRKGEAGLSKASVANVTQIATLDRASLSAKIGRLSRERPERDLAGRVLGASAWMNEDQPYAVQREGNV